MDVTTAFLNGTLKEEFYMNQPEGYIEKGKEKLVCRLNHSLYGLKQAPRCWNSVLNQKLKEIGFVQTVSDPCIYKAVSGDSFIIGLYVDDILLAGKSKERMTEVKSVLSNMFEVKDLGELNYFLGVKVVQNHKDGTKPQGWYNLDRSTHIHRICIKEVPNGPMQAIDHFC